MLLPTTFVNLLANWLLPTIQDQPALSFSLRHAHALGPDDRAVFSDAPAAFGPGVALRTRRARVSRPASQVAFHAARRLRGRSAALEWDVKDVVAPDTTDLATLRALAQMCNNAYFSPDQKGWYSLNDSWTADYPVGWEPEDDGFRGHVFVSADNSTVVLSIKGTDVPTWQGGSGGPTTRRDKLNDNLLFSCCCARVGWSWSPVCGCYAGDQRCDSACLEEALVEESLFYTVGTNLFNNITYMYPHAQIWITGHSLGGGLGALLGTTFGIPVVAFEAPAEALAARRLHLPRPKSTDHIVHVFNTGDPIPFGACTGVGSPCHTGGYALETRCHQGRKIVFDTVADRGWSVNIANHGIVKVIDEVLQDGTPVPQAVDEVEGCHDSECYNWEFGDYLNKTRV